MNIPRIYDDLAQFIKRGRVTVLYGARRTGKTTLVEEYLATQKGVNIIKTTGEDIVTQEILNSQSSERIREWTEDKDIVFIDEAQNVPQIGMGLKMLIDQRPDLNIIATGSASFELSNKLGEPLVGRQTPLQLFPISLMELAEQKNKSEIKQTLADYLVFGMYPEVLTAKTKQRKKEILDELTRSYLLKDILQIENVKNSKTLFRLLQLLAFQIGNEVSMNELASNLNIDKNTVARYLDLLEKCYVIYNLRGFSRNLRSEVTKTGKYYFCDLGVRNSLIQNYSPLDLRNDVGHLWENFVIIERLKRRTYNKKLGGNDYFWRTWEKQEIDLVEERDGKLFAYEIKWSGKKTPPAPVLWQENYGAESNFACITAENFWEFLVG